VILERESSGNGSLGVLSKPPAINRFDMLGERERGSLCAYSGRADLDQRCNVNMIESKILD